MFQRNQRKYDNAAHFTIRCSRRIDDDEKYPFLKMQNIQSSKFIVKDGKRNEFQLPIVVLVTNFPRPNSNSEPVLLSLNEIDTLFHEMGHAMHSMLAQTGFQHISGTRVPMDFVEVPSIIMELFSSLPEVLAFGRHFKTGEPVPLGLLNDIRTKQNQLEAFETQDQIQMALLDQIYHSKLAGNDEFNSTLILQNLQDRISPIKFVPGTAWQIQFSHLFSYGASYYSYLVNQI